MARFRCRSSSACLIGSRRTRGGVLDTRKSLCSYFDFDLG